MDQTSNVTSNAPANTSLKATVEERGPGGLSVDLAPGNRHHLWLANPVMIASGTFGYDGYGRGITPEMDLSRLGAVIPKTATRHYREGNPEPRWYPQSYRRAWDAGEFLFVNSIGLANPGIEATLSDVAPHWEGFGTTVLLSLAGESVAQFGEMAAMTRGVPGFQGLELNLSCPNVEDGALFSLDAKLTAAAVGAVRANTDLPVLAKLAASEGTVMQLELTKYPGDERWLRYLVNPYMFSPNTTGLLFLVINWMSLSNDLEKYRNAWRERRARRRKAQDNVSLYNRLR